MDNVLVTGASSPLGRRLLAHLQADPDVAHVYGVEPKLSAEWVNGIELLSFGPDHRDLVEFLANNRIDTVVHCGLAPDRSGDPAARGEARVIETMRLGAAIASEEAPVRSWVVASSSGVYPVASHAPLLHREDSQTDPHSPAAVALLEAEEYVRDVAVRRPHLNVSILRLQQLVGDGVGGAVANLLRQRVLPSVVGFDAPIQLLSIDDAVRALAFAAELELAGIYNVASSGVVRFKQALRELGRPGLPVLPFSAGPFAGVARRLGVPHLPEDTVDVVRFGHALDTSKLAAAGFAPEYDQHACLELLRG